MSIKIGESAINGELCQIYDFSMEKQQSPSASPVTSAAKQAEQYATSSYKGPDGTTVSLDFKSILNGKKKSIAE